MNGIESQFRELKGYVMNSRHYQSNLLFQEIDRRCRYDVVLMIPYPRSLFGVRVQAKGMLSAAGGGSTPHHTWLPLGLSFP
jgi:hypothetical protein